MQSDVNFQISRAGLSHPAWVLTNQIACFTVTCDHALYHVVEPDTILIPVVLRPHYTQVIWASDFSQSAHRKGPPNKNPYRAAARACKFKKSVNMTE